METLKEFLKPELIWILIGIVLFIMEFAIPGLIVFFFGLGACVVGIICFFADISINTQLLTFIGISVGSLLVLRKWLKSTFIGYIADKKTTTENLDEYVGQRAVVKTEILRSTPGKVEFHGTNWKAESDEDISTGTTVEIIGKQNLTLKVKPI